VVAGPYAWGYTNHWSHVALRYAPYDFGTDSERDFELIRQFPIYDLEPYYDRVERLIGVYGAAEGTENSLTLRQACFSRHRCCTRMTCGSTWY
jgi:choline dehydrogenase-like flavoprotein